MTDFKPNITPREMFQMGVFQGTYWRPINSRITGKKYGSQEYKKFPFLKDLPESIMNRPLNQADTNINYYRVKSGSTLEEWEDNGWITKHDPRGWIQWWSNYFAGKRILLEDERQIKRWIRTASPSSRFYKRLDNLVKQGKDSPKIRQTLLQWGVVYPIK